MASDHSLEVLRYSSHAVTACVFTSALSYVGHGENDSSAGH